MSESFELNGGIGLRGLDGDKSGGCWLCDDGYFRRTVAKVVLIEHIPLFDCPLNSDILL